MKSRTALLLAGAAGVLLLAARREAPPTAGEAPPAGLSGEEREVLALARMLASETSDERARIAVGWITVHAARSWGRSLFRLLTGKSGQFGPQKFFYADGNSEIRYASTARAATPETTRIARGLLDGTLKPPELIERTRPTAYVELGKASSKLGPDGKPLQPEYTADKILAKQQSYGGIVGRLNDWFFYAKGAPPISSIDQAARV
ncbi:MAG: hypothetical protein U1A78_41660 [Polyangia bacterium]